MTSEAAVDLTPPTPVVISPKTTHQQLIDLGSISQFDIRRGLTQDILKNAQELNPDVAWGLILQAISWNVAGHGRNLIGIAAIGEAATGAIVGTARAMGWDMHSPEVVYMSGSAVLSLLGRKLAFSDGILSAIEEGRTRFSSDEVRQQRMTEIKRESGALGANGRRINQSLGRYSKDYLPDSVDPDYIKALQNFPFMGHASRSAKHRRAINAFKSRKYGQAISILKNEPISQE